MTFNYNDRYSLEAIESACKKNAKLQKELIETCEGNTKLQRELLEAFNAQTKAIERQNELQERTIVALEVITSNTAPKVKHVKNQSKATQL